MKYGNEISAFYDTLTKMGHTSKTVNWASPVDKTPKAALERLRFINLRIASGVLPLAFSRLGFLDEAAELRKIRSPKMLHEAISAALAVVRRTEEIRSDNPNEESDKVFFRKHFKSAYLDSMHFDPRARALSKALWYFYGEKHWTEYGAVRKFSLLESAASSIQHVEQFAAEHGLHDLSLQCWGNKAISRVYNTRWSIQRYIEDIVELVMLQAGQAESEANINEADRQKAMMAVADAAVIAIEPILQATDEVLATAAELVT